MENQSLPQDILERIEHDFSGESRSHVLETLVSLKLARSSSANTQRVIRCMLFHAQGNLEAFDKIVIVAKRDWRDAIMAGEYGYSPDRKLIRCRNLTDSFPDSSTSAG